MADDRLSRRIIGPALYVALSLFILMISMAPIDTVLRTFFPMTLFAASFALILRDAKLVPLGVIAFVFLTRDLLFFQPIGLEAALAVIFLKFAFNRRRILNETLVKEWAGFAIFVIGFLAARALLYFVFVLPQPDLAQIARTAVSTVLLYPLVTGILSLQFGITKEVTA